jgi:PAS domain S-box-containing protein
MSDDVDILIVDDRPENLVTIEAVLGDENYRFVRANSGPEALLRILEHDFAVILIDVLMPGMDGFEVAQMVKRRERSSHVPIIFLSAEAADMSFIYRGYSVGAVDYLAKPLDPDVLRAKVAIFAELARKDRRIREQTEALRLANEQRYRNLAEAIPEIVWTADANGEITYFNARWYEYTGWAHDRAIGSGWQAALDPGDAQRVTNAWRAGLEHRHVFELETRLLRRDGASRWHLCRAVPELAEGQIVAWLGTFTDCDELKRGRDDAEQAVRARDEFLSIASHELRTPLSTLQLRLNSLKQELAQAPATEPAPRNLEACLRQSRRLVTLVEGVFDFSRITGGKLQLERERFDLREAARDAVERLADLAARAGATIRVEAAAAVEGCWDRVRIEQVIENLVGNAIKYAANAPVVVAVSVSPAMATLAVTDHGPGIASADLSRIFEAFERGSSPVSYGGLGLGLYIARAYVAAHHGTIAVASQPGAGTTFTVQLPRDSDGTYSSS